MDAVRHSRGDTNPDNPGLVFLRYKGSNEVWVTPEKLEKVRAQSKAIDKRWKAKDSAKEYKRTYAQRYYHRPKRKAQQAEYYRRGEVRAKYREKYHSNKDFYQKRNREYLKKPTAQARAKAYRQRPEVKKRVQAGHKKWRQTPRGRLIHNLRSRIYTALRNNGFKKTGKSKELFGCEWDQFKAHIESRFKLGMSWRNHGVFWHIDHIRPLARYDLSDATQQRQAFHYTNCQPLWIEENLRKNKYDSF